MSFIWFFSAFVIFFLLGAVWPDHPKLGLATYLQLRIAKSMFVGWLVFLIAYLFNLGALPTTLVISAILIFGLFVQYRRQSMISMDQSTIGVLSFLLLIAVAVISIFLIVDGVEQYYRPIFQTNDAVASWNRWAIELSKNEYIPLAAAYPILFPALWSLIYKVQGTSDIWIVAKGTMFVLPAILAISISLLLSARATLSAALLTIFCYIFFLERKLFYMFIGDMDIPVLVMLISAGCAIFVAHIAMERKEDAAPLVILAAILTGLAAITKQAGVLGFVPFISFLIISLRSKSITKRLAVISILISIIPIVTFYLIYLGAGYSPIDNLPSLRQLAKTSTNGLSRIQNSVRHLQMMLPGPLLLLLISVGIFNFASLKRKSSILGAIFFTTGFFGFLIFSDCCSYDERNGWWILSFLVVSSMFVLLRYEPLISQDLITTPSKRIFSALAVICLSLSIGFSAYLSHDNLKAIQERWQWSLMPSGTVGMLTTRFSQLGEDGKIISVNPLIKWLPGFDKRFKLCGAEDTTCVKETILQFPNSMIIVTPGVPVLYYEGVKELLIPNRLSGAIDGLEMYGPFTATDLQQ